MQTQQHPSKLPWADVYFAAEAAREPFQDVTVITARSEYARLALLASADIIHNGNVPLTSGRVQSLALLLISQGRITIQESVSIEDEAITAVINVPTTEDDDAMWKALDLVAEALDSLDGKSGKVYFGEQLKFSQADILPFIGDFAS